MLGRRLRLLMWLILAGSLAVTSSPLSASEITDDNQVPILNMAGEGDLHIYSDDTLELEVVDPPSMLALAIPNGTEFCSSADTGVCAGVSDLWFNAQLPICDSSTTTDCIVSVSASNASGTTNGTFSRYFPDRSDTSYQGKPSMKLPTGRAPSIWSLSGAPHGGGSDYAVVARLKGSTSKRNAAILQLVVTPVSLKSDADTSPSYQMPRWTQPGRLGGPTADRGVFRCAYWGENGACLLSRSFPAATKFTVTVRLAAEPAGWMHGRIDDPIITFTKNGDNTDVVVSALPVQVPAFRVAKKHAEFSAAVQTAFGPGSKWGNGGTRRPGANELTDITRRNAEYNIQAAKAEGFEQFNTILSTIEDKATYAPWIWRVRTLEEDEMRSAGKCLTTGSGVKGIVTTNATIYGSGPPAFNDSTKSIDYKVAAPHYTRTGDTFKGAYHLIMRSDVARCFYNFDSAPISAEISVVEEAGTTSTATTSASEQDGWFKVSAKGFTHSTPTVRVVLKQAANSTQTVPVATFPRATVKRAKSISGKSLARAAKLTTKSTSRISLSVAKKDQKTCRVAGTGVRGLRKGTCTVTVTVTTKGKKAKKSVSLTVR